MKWTDLNHTVTVFDLCNPNPCIKIQNISIIPKNPLIPLFNFHATPRGNHCSNILLYHRLALPIVEYYTNGISQYIFVVQLLSYVQQYICFHVNFFFTQDFFETHSCCYMHLQSVPLYCRIIFHDTAVHDCLSICLLMDSWSISRFYYYE